MQRKMSDHTFVIPAYKESPYLESCIQSLQNQTIKSEIILTTSTPSPFLADMASQYGLSYHINTQAGGIASDWNFALSKSNTSLATIAHQDDIYAPLYAENVVKAGTDYPDALIIFTSSDDLIGDKIRSFSLNSFIKKTLLWPFYISKCLTNKYSKKLILLFGDPISCPTVTFNMASLNNSFAFSTAYTCALDWKAWLDLSGRKGSFIYIDEKLVQHRIHEGSETTNQLKLGLRQKEELQIFEEIWGITIAKIMSKFYASGYKDNEI
jgi:glycosyltransferase involved in cell wall biosynthesis